MSCELPNGPTVTYLNNGTVTASGLDIYTNSTMVTSPFDGSSSIAPYERWSIDLSEGDSCEIHHCNDNIGCNPWILPYTTNSFALTTHSNATCKPKAFGWKGVQARRAWHGTFGFLSHDPSGCNSTICDTGAFEPYQSTIDQTKYLTAVYDAVREEIGEGSTYTYDSGANQWVAGTLTQSFARNSTAAGTRSINADSGELTNGVKRQADYYNYFDEEITFPFPHYKHIVDGAGWDANPLDGGQTASNCGETALDADLNTPPFCLTDVPSISQSVFIWNSSVDPTYAVTSTPITSVDGWSLTVTIPGFDDVVGSVPGATYNPPIPDSVLDISVTRTNTEYSWTVTLDIWNGDFTTGLSHIEYHTNGSVTLSNENVASDIYSDLQDNLLSQWDMADDDEYPWRDDSFYSAAPLVSRREKQNSSPIGFDCEHVNDLRSPIADSNGTAPFADGWNPTYNTTDYFDPQAYAWVFPEGMDQSNSSASALSLQLDGTILGAPLPAGYQGYFDFGFIDWVGCCFDNGDDPPSWDWYQLGYGMSINVYNFQVAASLPLNATQWTNNFQNINKPQGAWLIYADHGQSYYPQGISCTNNVNGVADAGFLWGGKYAEIIDPWQAQNFARPAGIDKFNYDETKGVYCASNTSGTTGSASTWSLIDSDGDTVPDGGDWSGLWGGPVVGGFYEVDYSGGALTLGAQHYDCPSNWQSMSDDTGVCFGQLRWHTASAILGREAISIATSSSSASVYTWQNAQPQFGMTSSNHSELVDFFDKNMGALATGVAVMRVDDSTFTSSSPADPDTRYIMSTGNPAAWYMNVNRPRGYFGKLEWLLDLRTPQENQRCAPIVDCSGDPIATGSFSTGYASFSQVEGCLPLVPCSPMVVAVSPNGEEFPNGITYGFPSEFILDERYGSHWQAFIQATMTDLLWQKPHTPVGIIPAGNPDGDVLKWLEDDGTCHGPSDDPGDDLETIHTRYYPYEPQVCTRYMIPNNYGPDHNETAPDLPDGIQIGWLSPVDNDFSSGSVAFVHPPVGFDGSGKPSQVGSSWALKQAICASLGGGGCLFSSSYAFMASGCVFISQTMQSPFVNHSPITKNTKVPIVNTPSVKRVWPKWALVIAKLRSDSDKGVGSTIERVIGAKNSLAFKAWFKATFGRSCGCSERKEKWDAEYNYLHLPKTTDTIQITKDF